MASLKERMAAKYWGRVMNGSECRIGKGKIVYTVVDSFLHSKTSDHMASLTYISGRSGRVQCREVSVSRIKFGN